MNSQQTRTIYTISLFFVDILAIFLGFFLAYQLRLFVAWPEPLANVFPLNRYLPFTIILALCIVTALFFYRQYYIPRSVSRVDMFYYISAGVSIGMMMAIAITSLLFKDDQVIQDYPRAMMGYAWVLTILLIMLGRIIHQITRTGLQGRGVGKDRLLIVGSGDVAEAVIQRVRWTPHLGYDLIGIVSDDTRPRQLQGIPVLGQSTDLPSLIERYKIDEVIVAMPEKGHRETVRVISYCERGRVSIKIFPDVFQFITSDASIDHLGGLPLLSVRDFALRGYLLIFKRLMDILGSLFGLVFLSPFFFFTAIAIKLESPGPAFFIQERMSLDGKPFLMIKFRSMRRDAEKNGPGWTVDNDPRQTRLGKLIRKFEFDELPNLINVFLGEMSLVGPRPEQAHYVEQFRQQIPRYMDRHREKGGMTGWAQVNGLRGDTSVIERTKYDLWYSENWSIWLDIKILIRTIWQIVDRSNNDRKLNEEEVAEEMKRPFATPLPTSENTQPYKNGHHVPSEEIPS